jgi:hypothetical protein
MNRSSHSRTAFWAIAVYFRKAGRTWEPASAGYEVKRTIDWRGKPFLICLKIHVVETVDKRSSRRSPWRFLSSVTLWPPTLTKGDEKRIGVRQWRSLVQQTLVRSGYRGKWSKSLSGVWGDFWKKLSNVGNVEREAKRLLQLEQQLRAIAMRRSSGSLPKMTERARRANKRERRTYAEKD